MHSLHEDKQVLKKTVIAIDEPHSVWKESCGSIILLVFKHFYNQYDDCQILNNQNMFYACQQHNVLLCAVGDNRLQQAHNAEQRVVVLQE